MTEIPTHENHRGRCDITATFFARQSLAASHYTMGLLKLGHDVYYVGPSVDEESNALQYVPA